MQGNLRISKSRLPGVVHRCGQDLRKQRWGARDCGSRDQGVRYYGSRDQDEGAEIGGMVLQEQIGCVALREQSLGCMVSWSQEWVFSTGGAEILVREP